MIDRLIKFFETFCFYLISSAKKIEIKKNCLVNFYYSYKFALELNEDYFFDYIYR